MIVFRQWSLREMEGGEQSWLWGQIGAKGSEKTDVLGTFLQVAKAGRVKLLIKSSLVID